VHGAGDDVVPVEQSERYARAATAAGDAVEVRVLPGDHMVLIDPASDAWRTVRDWLAHRRPRPPYA
jgi:dipeptidyl aminopeptidase/acylaminoacyl peptidase